MSSTYESELGERYFSYQLAASRKFADIEAAKFASAIRHTDVVLDFGCGSGLILAEIVCRRKIGIEVNPAAREYAREQGIECFSSLAAVASTSIDTVISNHALEHVERPVEVLREIRRVLKSPGRLLLCVPIDDWRTEHTYSATDPNHHLYTWSVQLLGNCLAASGFLIQPRSIRVITHAIPHRYISALRRALPAWAFRWCCIWFAALWRRRQLIADVAC